MKVRFQMFPYFFCLLDGPWLGSDGQSQSIGIFPWLGSDGQSQSIGIFPLQSQRWTKSIHRNPTVAVFFVPYIHLVKVYTIKIKTLDFFRRPRFLFAN